MYTKAYDWPYYVMCIDCVVGNSLRMNPGPFIILYSRCEKFRRFDGLALGYSLAWKLRPAFPNLLCNHTVAASTIFPMLFLFHKSSFIYQLLNYMLYSLYYSIHNIPLTMHNFDSKKRNCLHFNSKHSNVVVLLSLSLYLSSLFWDRWSICMLN